LVDSPSASSLADKIRCDACPVACYIRPGASGACDRYANVAGKLVRVDPHVLLQDTVDRGGQLVPFHQSAEWGGNIFYGPEIFVTAIGAGTTYPDHKPAPLIISSNLRGVDMVTVVTEGIFSYCGVKVKIDTDRHLGPETAIVRASGEAVGHVTTGEYGSQMLSLGGVHLMTGGSKKEGRATCDTVMNLCNGIAVDLTIEGGSSIVVQAGKPPIIDGKPENRMRAGCGSATVGMFAKQWHGQVDDVVVVDDHITGVLSEHLAGQSLGIRPTGIRLKGKRSTPGRYFQVAEPGSGWGGTDISDPLAILGSFDAKKAWPGLRLLMVSTTGEQWSYYELNDQLIPVEKPLPPHLRPTIDRIEQNCETGLCTVMFMAGAGGSLRAGVTENPIKLTQSVGSAMTSLTCGGAPVFIWPGGGITFMVDVTKVPAGAFGYVPTPAVVAPIEFTLRLADYVALGGHVDCIRPLSSLEAREP
jgi:6-hydroxynicotinate reductase